MSMSAAFESTAAVARPPRPPVGPQGGWMSRELTALGTRLEVELWADDRARGAAAMAAVLAEAQRIDRQFSAHRPDSELAMLNRLAGVRAVRIGDEAFQLLARGLEFSQAGGAPLVRGGDGGVASGRPLRLDANGPCAALLQAGLQVDLAPLLAGHALNRGVALLRRSGVRHARLAAGGLTAWMGDRRGLPWPLPAWAPEALPRLQDLALAARESDSPAAPRPWAAAGDALVAQAALQALCAGADPSRLPGEGALRAVRAWGRPEAPSAEAA